MKPTKKAFREYLNRTIGYSNAKHGAAGTRLRSATKRLYGDYLYSSDKEMFDVEYARWVQK